jgi:hypothetical protein
MILSLYIRGKGKRGGAREVNDLYLSTEPVYLLKISDKG